MRPGRHVAPAPHPGRIAGGTALILAGSAGSIASRVAELDALFDPARPDAAAFDAARAQVTTPQHSRYAVQGVVALEAARAGVDPALALAVAATESNFNPAALSGAGAAGVMQLMPDTAAAFGVSDRFDPAQNARGGASYLRQLIDRFGDVRLAVAAYNAGPEAVQRFGDVPPFAETRTYVDRVLGSYQAYRSSSPP